MSYVIKNSETSVNGNDRENVFLAFSEDNLFLGYSFVYPSINHEVTPLDPLSLYLDVSVEKNDLEVKKALFNKVVNRAKEIRNQYPNLKARMYSGMSALDKEKIDFYTSLGFIKDDGTYLYQINLSDVSKFEVYEHIIETTLSLEEVEQILTIQKQIFVRPLDLESYQSLETKNLFKNFCVYEDHRIVADIMVYEKDGVGFIENLIVLKHLRKNKLASKLVMTALKYFKNNGINIVQLEVWGRNVYAVNLYRQLGFQYVKEIEVYPGIQV